MPTNKKKHGKTPRSREGKGKGKEKGKGKGKGKGKRAPGAARPDLSQRRSRTLMQAFGTMFKREIAQLSADHAHTVTEFNSSLDLFGHHWTTMEYFAATNVLQFVPADKIDGATHMLLQYFAPLTTAAKATKPTTTAKAAASLSTHIGNQPLIKLAREFRVADNAKNGVGIMATTGTQMDSVRMTFAIPFCPPTQFLFTPGLCTSSFRSIMGNMLTMANERERALFFNNALHTNPLFKRAWVLSLTWDPAPHVPDPVPDLASNTGFAVFGLNAGPVGVAAVGSSPLFPADNLRKYTCFAKDYYAVFGFNLSVTPPKKARVFWTMRVMVCALLRQNFDMRASAASCWTTAGVENAFLGIRDPASMLFGTVNTMSSLAFAFCSVSTGKCKPEMLKAWVKAAANTMLADQDLPSFAPGKRHECLVVYLLLGRALNASNQFFQQDTNVSNLFLFCVTFLYGELLPNLSRRGAAFGLGVLQMLARCATADTQTEKAELEGVVSCMSCILASMIMDGPRAAEELVGPLNEWDRVLYDFVGRAGFRNSSSECRTSVGEFAVFYFACGQKKKILAQAECGPDSARGGGGGGGGGGDGLLQKRVRAAVRVFGQGPLSSSPAAMLLCPDGREDNWDSVIVQSVSQGMFAPLTSDIGAFASSDVAFVLWSQCSDIRHESPLAGLPPAKAGGAGLPVCSIADLNARVALQIEQHVKKFLASTRGVPFDVRVRRLDETRGAAATTVKQTFVDSGFSLDRANNLALYTVNSTFDRVIRAAVEHKLDLDEVTDLNVAVCVNSRVVVGTDEATGAADATRPMLVSYQLPLFMPEGVAHDAAAFSCSSTHMRVVARLLEKARAFANVVNIRDVADAREGGAGTGTGTGGGKGGVRSSEARFAALLEVLLKKASVITGLEYVPYSYLFIRSLEKSGTWGDMDSWDDLCDERSIFLVNLLSSTVACVLRHYVATPRTRDGDMKFGDFFQQYAAASDQAWMLGALFNPVSVAMQCLMLLFCVAASLYPSCAPAIPVAADMTSLNSSGVSSVKCSFQGNVSMATQFKTLLLTTTGASRLTPEVFDVAVDMFLDMVVPCAYPMNPAFRNAEGCMSHTDAVSRLRRLPFMRQKLSAFVKHLVKADATVEPVLLSCGTFQRALCLLKYVSYAECSNPNCTVNTMTKDCYVVMNRASGAKAGTSTGRAYYCCDGCYRDTVE